MYMKNITILEVCEQHTFASVWSFTPQTAGVARSVSSGGELNNKSFSGIVLVSRLLLCYFFLSSLFPFVFFFLPFLKRYPWVYLALKGEPAILEYYFNWAAIVL